MFVVIQVFDFLFALVEGLKGEAYIFSEFEANILFPCLVEKVCHISIMQMPFFLDHGWLTIFPPFNWLHSCWMVRGSWHISCLNQSGHNIEKVREKVRELIRLLCSIYSAPKVFGFITDGLKSKNNRTRIECVENIEFMIEQCGIEVHFGFFLEAFDEVLDCWILTQAIFVYLISCLLWDDLCITCAVGLCSYLNFCTPMRHLPWMFSWNLSWTTLCYPDNRPHKSIAVHCGFYCRKRWWHQKSVTSSTCNCI